MDVAYLLPTGGLMPRPIGLVQWSTATWCCCYIHHVRALVIGFLCYGALEIVGVIIIIIIIIITWLDDVMVRAPR